MVYDWGELTRFFLACINPISRWLSGTYAVLGLITWCRDEWLPEPWKDYHILNLLPDWPIYLWVAIGLLIGVVAIGEGVFRDRLLLQEAPKRSKPIFNSSGIPYQSIRNEHKFKTFIAPGIIVLLVATPWLLSILFPSVIGRTPAKPPEIPASPQQAFHVAIRSAYYAPQTLMYARYKTVYPIDLALYMQFVNIQGIKSKIATYAVQVAEAADGPWKSLLPLQVRDGELCFDSKHDVTRVTFADPIGNLRELVETQSFEPHETKSGWGFFRRHDISQADIKYFRVTVQETTGLSSIHILPGPKARPESEADLSMGGFKGIRTADISNYQFHRSIPSYPD